MDPTRSRFFRLNLMRWVCSGFLLASVLVAAEPANLSGTWTLNKDLSDKPPERMQAWKSQTSQPPAESAPSDTEKNGGHHGKMDFQKAFGTLTIQQSGDRIVLKNGWRERILYTDGRLITENGPRGAAEVHARWENGQMIVDAKPERGPARTETYSVSDNKLTIQTHVDAHGDMPEMTFKRVYDATPVSID
jgi:hypothetical protein